MWVQPYKAINLNPIRSRQRKQVMAQGLWLLVALLVLCWRGRGSLGTHVVHIHFPSHGSVTTLATQRCDCLTCWTTTAAEAIQQSVRWLPLLAGECHPDARLFLCSLFALVCLDR